MNQPDQTPKKSIVEACSQKILFEIPGYYTLREFDGHHYFLEGPDGDGTTVQKIDVLCLFRDLFERNM